MENMNFGTRSAEQMALDQANFISKVYAWMGLALLMTGAVAIFVSSTPELVNLIFGTRFLFFGLLIGEVLLVMYLSSAVLRLSAETGTLLFMLYAFLNGITLSVLFLAYTQASIASTFFITAGTFGVMSAYGYYTKKDLTTLGNLLFTALIGLVIATVVNLFFRNELFYWMTTYVGILIFVGLTAYDTQKIKAMFYLGVANPDMDRKAAILGALQLYLDFINLFIYLLRIFGRRN